MNKLFEASFKYENLDLVFKEKVSKVKSRGIDKKSARHFKIDKESQLKILEKKIEDKKFKFSPYLELLKVKNRDSPPRLICIPTIRDRIVLSISKNILHEIFSDSVNRDLPNSYIRKIKTYIKDNEGANIYYLKTDIKSFYDEIDRDILIGKLKKRIKNKFFLYLVKSAIENPTVPSNYRKADLEKYFPKKGVAQGLPISNILAQIYLKEYDIYFQSKLNKSLYLRYVDDIIILSKRNCKPLLKTITKELDKINLNINLEKTSSGKIDKGFDFLGYLIKKECISMSKKSIESPLNKIAAKITWFKKGLENRLERPEALQNDDKKFKKRFLKEVNEIITGSISKNKNYGWLFHFSEIDDKTVFYKIDNAIDKMFKKLKPLGIKKPKGLKKMSKAFFEIKHNKEGGYINNYDKLNTSQKKRQYLSSLAQIEPDKDYTDEEIDEIFDWSINGNLRNLESDIRYAY